MTTTPTPNDNTLSDANLRKVAVQNMRDFWRMEGERLAREIEARPAEARINFRTRIATSMALYIISCRWRNAHGLHPFQPPRNFS